MRDFFPRNTGQPQRKPVKHASPSRSGKALHVLFVTLLIALAGAWYLNRERFRLEDADSASKKAPAEHPQAAGSLEEGSKPPAASTELVRERQLLDQTVWSEEVLAQRYEGFFVQLWDQLRAASNKLAVMETIPFETLNVGQLQEVGQSDWGILLSDCGGPERQLSTAEFAAELQQLAQAGLRIIQTEWHHSKFETGGSAGARSTVSIRIDAENKSTQTRYTITGDILVDWQPQPDSSDLPQAKSIDTRGLRMMQRSGPLAFETMRKIDAREIGIPVSVPSVIAYDLNGDGLSEILLPSANIIYRNLGDWNFEPFRLFSDPSTEEVTASVAADFNGDGSVDLFCASAGSPSVFFSDSEGSFLTPGKVVDMGGEALVFPSAVTAGDIDADGDLDIWLAQYKPAYHFGQMPTPYYDANDGFPSHLLLNDGNGQFHDATQPAGLAVKRNRRTYSACFVDLDQDNDLDLAVAGDYSGLDLYLNDGKGNFQDVTASLNEDRHGFGMSLTLADFDLDQRTDIYMTGMASTTARRLEQLGLGRDEFAEHQEKRSVMGYGNRMFLSKPTGFSQAAFNDQVARTGWSWGSSSLDFDNDGDSDIYVANGHRSNQTAKDYCTRFWTHDIYTGSSQHDPQLANFFQGIFATEFLPISWNGFEHNCLLMNLDGAGFSNVGFLMGVAHEFDSRNVISDDFDGDGKLDLLVVGKAADEPQGSIYLIRNVFPDGGHWIGVHLHEKALGRSPMGARVKITFAGGGQVATIVSGDSLYSQHASTAHFGLGEVAEVEAIDVFWPDGATSRIEQPAVDRYHWAGGP